MSEKWIDVSNPPKSGRTVLVYRENGGYIILTYRIIKFRDNPPEGEWLTDDGLYTFNGKAFWLDEELPSPSAMLKAREKDNE